MLSKLYGNFLKILYRGYGSRKGKRYYQNAMETFYNFSQRRTNLVLSTPTPKTQTTPPVNSHLPFYPPHLYACSASRMWWMITGLVSSGSALHAQLHVCGSYASYYPIHHGSTCGVTHPDEVTRLITYVILVYHIGTLYTS